MQASPPPPQPTPWSAAFARDGYLKVEGLLSPVQAADTRRYMEKRLAENGFVVDVTLGIPFTDFYGDARLDSLMAALLPKVEYCSGLWLYPTYSYGRAYRRSDRLPRHRDRPACEVSISLNLGQTPDEPWPLYVLDRNNNPAAALLRPGDALLYRGIELTHWRDPYPGEALFQVFMHYVDRNGPHANERFDRRESLGTPAVR